MSITSCVSYINRVTLYSCPQGLVHATPEPYDIRLDSQSLFKGLLDSDQVKKVGLFEVDNNVNIALQSSITLA